MRRHFLSIGIFLFAGIAATAKADDSCPYLAPFKTLKSQLPKMPPARAAKALQRYVETHENPEGCELTEIDRLLGENERQLVRLSAQGKFLSAHVVFRCNEFDPRTAQCQSPMQDGTPHPAQAGIQPSALPPAHATLVARLHRAKLVGVYRVSLADAVDGKPATPLELREGRLALSEQEKPWALMAVFETSGPWRYRKAVWYLHP